MLLFMLSVYSEYSDTLHNANEHISMGISTEQKRVYILLYNIFTSVTSTGTEILQLFSPVIYILYLYEEHDFTIKQIAKPPLIFRGGRNTHMIKLQE